MKKNVCPQQLGTIFRELRLSKGMTLEETSKGIVSLPFLSKFERGEHEITSNKFIRLLSRLNISYREFELILGHLEGYSQTAFLQQLSTALVNNDLTLLNQLYDDQKLLLKQYSDSRFEHNLIIISQYINLLNGLSFEPHKIKRITDYLYRVEEWGEYELVLFGNSLNFIPIEKMYNLSKIAIKRSTMFAKSPKHINELGIIIGNIIHTLIDNNHFEGLNNLFIQAENMLNGTDYFAEINRINFYKGIYLILNGNQNKGLSISKNAISLLNQMRRNDLAREYESFLYRFTN
jgi:transcriptional activator, rgg/gadR/mutR family, C-terminal domain